MDDVRPAVPVLRFHAGPLLLAIAAEDVLRVTAETSAGEVHIAALFGVAPSGAERRRVEVMNPDSPEHAPSTVAFQADSPIDVVQCEVEHIMPLPAGIPAGRWKPIMGFAQFAEQTVILLDIPDLIAALMHKTQRGVS